MNRAWESVKALAVSVGTDRQLGRRLGRHVCACCGGAVWLAVLAWGDEAWLSRWARFFE